jgi:hypothetical protein
LWWRDSPGAVVCNVGSALRSSRSGRRTPAYRVDVEWLLPTAKLHVAHEMEGEVGGGWQGLVQVFGDKEFLAILVAEGLGARARS